MDSTRGCPWCTSSNGDGPGGTSGAGLSDTEEPARRQRIKGTPGTAGLLKGPGDQGREAATVTAGAEEEGRTNCYVGQRGFLPKAAQRTGQLGGSNKLKPATLWESVA
ncbi:hypothetical protein NDU88_005074 [Pleurodeles waltl]|uniref:Uncharacterized protein n=1 Tax=Pleurodeles waltl TaxID=8319 RepID=A0AAV7NQD4_PLEWA|nr:hypothetical protein NDU88_005074 [Pleurodeles waltl]